MIRRILLPVDDSAAGLAADQTAGTCRRQRGHRASSEDAGVEAGVSPAVGSCWFRESGGASLSPCAIHFSRVSVFRRAGGDRGLACSRFRRSPDRGPYGPFAADDLVGATTQRGNSGWDPALVADFTEAQLR